MPRIRFRPSKKQTIIFGAIASFLILVAIIYRLTSLWKPDQSLLALLPDAPICYVSMKDLGGFVEAFQRSELGVQAAQMPIIAEIQREFWWRRIVYQKRMWEAETGGKLDLKMIRGYVGEEAILSFYKRGDQISFLLISVVGAKQKLEIATLTAAAPVNPHYKRLKENYRELDINTITGYPRDFSYAFVGKIGLLTTDKSLIQDTIDIYAKQKKGFTERQAMGDYLRKQYNGTRNTVYIVPPRLAEVFEFDESLKLLLKGVNVWTFSNRYEKGVIHSQHRMIRNANSRLRHSPRPADKNLFSILPATTALLSVSNDADLTVLWKQIRANLSLQYQQNGIDLSRYLEAEIAVALLPPPGGAPALVPSMLLICPIQDQAGLEAALTKLRQAEITLNGKPFQFPPPREYQGIEFQPAQLQLGFMFALKGGYAFIDNYWVIGTTLGALKSSINAFTGQDVALSDAMLPDQLGHPSHSHILIRPSGLIPELKRLIPIAGLLASAAGQQIDPKLTMRITNNLFPLEALGLITAGINFSDDFAEAQIQIILEE